MMPNMMKKTWQILLLALVFFAIGHGNTYASANVVQIIQLDDETINPITAEYIDHAITKAEAEKAECLIIKLDTPGGLLNSTRTIVKKILASTVPVVVYIAPGGSRAGSAGVFITYASHVAVMAPSTNIGAAHPVQLGGENRRPKDDSAEDLKQVLRALSDQIKSNKKDSAKDKKEIVHSDDDPMSSKILNDTVAWVTTLANKRGRNAQWAVKSVTESASITETEALQSKVIDFIAKDDNELLEKLDGRSVRIEDKDIVLRTKGSQVEMVSMTGRQKFFNVLANPNIAYVLFILGFYGLLYEVTHPGFGVPGVLGIVFLILAFTSMQALATNYAGLALIVLGICFFIAEALTPGLGILAFGGIVCTGVGSLLLFDGSVPGMGISLSLIATFTLTTAALTIFLVTLVIRSHRNKVVSGAEGMIDEEGEVYTRISQGKQGKVSVHGEIWNAIADETLEKGEPIIVEQVNGLILTVKKLK